MKQKAKRFLAIVCIFAMVLGLAAFNPATAYAAEAEEPYEAPNAETEGSYDVYASEADEPYGAPNSVSVTITQETNFSFTPNATGYWTFVTSNNQDSTPRLWVINYYGHILATDRGSAEGGNAIIKLHLVEGAPYVIRAGFDWGGVGTYTLTLFRSDEFVRPIRPGTVPTEIPGHGGVFYGRDRILYSFIPDTCGLWEIRIIGSGETVEFEIRDDLWNTLAFDYEWGNEFHGTVRLVAGVQYEIRGWSDWDADYILAVAPTDTFIPWIDWDMWERWGVTIDFEADRLLIPPYGGELFIEGDTHLTFTPDATGMWTLFIDMGDSSYDSMIVITDTYGSFITGEEGWMGWGAWIDIDLSEGVEYVIWISCPWYDEFSFYLIVEFWLDRDWDWYYDWDWDWYDDWDVDIDWDDLDSWMVRIPSAGGYVTVGDDFMFLFSPDETGSWSIQVANADWADFTVSDLTGSFWLSQWDTGVISMHMAAGHDYTVEVWVGWGNDEAILLVSPTYVINPPRADAVTQRRVFMNETEFSFTPVETGYWVIYTSHNVGATDPFLWLLDADGYIVAQDDDGGEGLNALIKVHLEAGSTYTIRAGFFIGGGEYMLTVRMAGALQTELELVVLEPPAL